MRMDSQLQHSLNAEDIRLIQLVARTAKNLGYASYLVGGIVRDILMERKVTDLDIVLEGNSIQLVKHIEKMYGGRQIIHNRFGTAKWKIDPTDRRISTLLGLNDSEREHALPKSIDLISARSETYAKPTALPTVSAGNLQDDLLRRDFTINAMAIQIDGEQFGDLIDPWGGQEDLVKKQIRILHDQSFIDDPTRILRAVRFERRLGFRLEDKTSILLEKSLGYLKQVSGARIRHELEHILEEDNRNLMLARLRELKVLTSIHQGLDWTPELELPFEKAKIVLHNASSQDYATFRIMSLKAGLAFIIWLMRFSKEQSLSIFNRLSLSAGLIKVIESAQSLWEQKEKINTGSNSEATFFLDKFEIAAIYALMCFHLGKEKDHILENYLRKWRSLKPFTDGTMLKALGIPVGPRYKLLLKELRAAWLDEKIKTAQQEQIFLANLLAKK